MLDVARILAYSIAFIILIQGMGFARKGLADGVLTVPDFVGTRTELTFRVYQVSAQVGRGFASAERTVDI